MERTTTQNTEFRFGRPSSGRRLGARCLSSEEEHAGDSTNQNRAKTAEECPERQQSLVSSSRLARA